MPSIVYNMDSYLRRVWVTMWAGLLYDVTFFKFVGVVMYRSYDCKKDLVSHRIDKSG